MARTPRPRWLDGESLRTVSRPFEVWRDREALAAVLRDVAAEVAAGPADAVAITMTAELSDAFRTKREGVAFVLDAAQDALGDRPLSVLTTAGELVSVAAARARPWDVAAANWVATALAVARGAPRRAAHRRRQHDRRHRPDRRRPRRRDRRTTTSSGSLAGELVYTGVLRTNLAAIAPRVPVRGGWCPVSSEYFAISADVHLVLGHLAPDAYDCPTPDGRAATVAFARERIARLVCSDVEQLDAAEIDAIAAYLHGEQLRVLEEAARRVQRTLAARRARRPGRRGRLPRARGRRAPRAGGRRRAMERDRRRDGARRGARGAAGGAPVLTVVKVGGGLGRGAGDDALRALCRTLGEARASATRCSSCPAARGSPTPCARPTAASRCPRRPRTTWRSSAWSSSAGC